MARLLISRQKYFAAGVHIGMKQKTKDMREFIYKIRPDGLAILNLRKIDQRIRIAAKFLAKAKDLMVVGRKTTAPNALKKFGEAVGAKIVTGRFMPGTLTNSNYKDFFEADVMLIIDPIKDVQALREAVKARVPIVSLCNTIHETKFIDLIVPTNNRGKKSLATVLWLLAREILKERKAIKSDDEFKLSVEDFEGK